VSRGGRDILRGGGCWSEIRRALVFRRLMVVGCGGELESVLRFSIGSVLRIWVVI
jgi:hypothetical protein